MNYCFFSLTFWWISTLQIGPIQWIKALLKKRTNASFVWETVLFRCYYHDKPKRTQQQQHRFDRFIRCETALGARWCWRAFGRPADATTAPASTFSSRRRRRRRRRRRPRSSARRGSRGGCGPTWRRRRRGAAAAPTASPTCPGRPARTRPIGRNCTNPMIDLKMCGCISSQKLRTVALERKKSWILCNEIQRATHCLITWNKWLCGQHYLRQNR